MFSTLLRRHGFSLSLSAIFWGALGLRLWGLTHINQLTFDEVHYAQYGVNYLTRQPVFDAHPPLGKYLIALGIWFGEHVLFRGAEVRNDAAGLELSPLSYRWLNAVVGASIPLLIAGVALQLTGRRRLAVLAGLFAAADGFVLVESRFALLHVYLVAFGMLGQWCFLQALRSPPNPSPPNPSPPNPSLLTPPLAPPSTHPFTQWQWLLNAGLSFGACVSIKWNGLGYWLVPVVVWFAIAGLRQLGRPTGDPGPRGLGLSAIRFWPGIVGLILMPALFYAVLWLPHLRDQTDVGLIAVHEQMLDFHRSMDDEAATAHPYCSPWWSWPLLLRPMAYFFQRSPDQQWRYAVYALGNPILWWLTSLAIALLCATLIATGWQQWRFRGDRSRFEHLAQNSPLLLPQRDRWIAIYLICNYAANWLPWVIVKRCTFIYHHLGAMSFGLIAVAFWCDRWLKTGKRPQDQLFLAPRWPEALWPTWWWVTLAIVVLILIAFVFWLPLYLGLPLTERGFYLRFWLPSWI